MEWWVWTGLAALLLIAYIAWLAARLGRLHRRAASAGAALDASLVRRAAAAILLADELVSRAPRPASQLRVAARTALAATRAEREAAENDLTQVLRQLADDPAEPAPGWTAVVTASRRVGLARQVHTDLVRDALAVRRRVLVRLLGLARRYPEPAYFDVGDPGLEDHADWTGEPSRR